MKTTSKIRSTVLYALLLFLPASVSAAEQITVKAKFIQSSVRAIPHDMAKLAKMKAFDIMTAPSVITKSGQQAQIEVVRGHQPVGVAPGVFKPIPVGTTLHVTPHLKGDKIAFTVRFTVSELITNKAREGQARSEVSSRDLYVSGISKDGEEVWFDFLDPNSKKKISVWMLLTTK